MLKADTYQLSRCYSELKGLQKAKTITYSVFAKDNGAIIALRSKSKEEIYAQSCFLPETSYEKAKDIATMLIENSLEKSIWINILDEIGVRYILMDSYKLHTH